MTHTLCRILLRRGMRFLSSIIIFFSIAGALAAQDSPTVLLEGTVLSEPGAPSSGTTVVVGKQVATTGPDGRYYLPVHLGSIEVELRVADSTLFSVSVDIKGPRTLNFTLHAGQTVTVTAQADVLDPDPSTRVYSRADVIDANPGRPGVPLSIPGLPVETASGGIKAPQYFAPGVAGDHGEPIAQYIGISSFSLQNNLTANAHGNGYSDPNFLVAGVIDGAVVDDGAFNVRYGDHSVNLAVTYDLRFSLPDSLQASTTGKDAAVGFTKKFGSSAWLAGEALFGNGWLARPEERQQYKINALRDWTAGNHQLTLFGVGYYGFSRVPGLIPLDVPVPSETVDSRQSDLTHTSIGALADHWQIDSRRSLSTGVFFRTYSLDLRSNFGDGLIKQSEFRTVAAGSSIYQQDVNSRLTVLAGLEERREAPRALNLDHLDQVSQRFTAVSSNNLTIYTTSVYAAAAGKLLPQIAYYAGLRRDQLCFENQDLLAPQNSFNACPGLTSPKLTLTFGSPAGSLYPQIALSFGKAFHANDPRIGTGSNRGQLLTVSPEYQAVVSKQIGGLDLRTILGQVSTSAEFGQIDADTGLQNNVGPGLNRFFTMQVSQRTAHRFWQASWSEADARDRSDGTPIPEAPRLIVDALYSTSHLPLGLSGKTEFEYVKAKPLGDGFNGIPLREIRFELSRSFAEGRWLVVADGQAMHGFSGQTTETLSVGGETAFERPVGVPVASYATLGLRYNFKP